MLRVGADSIDDERSENKTCRLLEAARRNILGGPQVVSTCHEAVNVHCKKP